MQFSKSDLKYFIDNIYNEKLFVPGSMGAVDMFTLHYALKVLEPDVVIESGVWHGASTELIRKTIGENAKIISLDPMEIPEAGWKDNNKNTVYHTGNNFIDFKNLDLSEYNSKKIFVFFDDHQNMVERLKQSKKKNIKHILYNDNYPQYCGSHFTIEHLLHNDFRNINTNAKQIVNINKSANLMTEYKNNKNEFLSWLENYHIFPNIFPCKIKTGEGIFDCKSFFEDDSESKTFYLFKQHSSKYRWNTYIKIK